MNAKKLLLFGLFVTLAQSAHADQVTYGDVYLEEIKTTSPSPWEIGVSYGYELSNPYVYSHSASITVLHTIGKAPLSRFFRAGVKMSRFFSQESDLSTSLSENLPKNISIESINQTYSTYVIGDLIPLQGQVNFFDNAPVDFDLRIRIGAGAIYYTDSAAPALLWAIRPGVMVSKNIGVHFSVGQEWESPFNPDERLGRLMGEAGLSFCF